MNKIAVYIASPYTQGDVAANVNRSFIVALDLIKKGFLPYCPLWTHFLHFLFPQSYEFWMDFSMSWLERCDCVLHLPGESYGADKEVELAHKLEMPTFDSVDALVEFWKNTDTEIYYNDN